MNRTTCDRVRTFTASILLACALGSSCALPKKQAPPETGRKPVVRADEVRLYLNTRGIEGRFEVIAVLRPGRDTTFVDRDVLIADARAKVAQLGGNGLLLGPLPEHLPEGEAALAKDLGQPMVAILVTALMGPPIESAPKLVPMSMVAGSEGVPEEQTAELMTGPSFREWLEAKEQIAPEEGEQEN